MFAYEVGLPQLPPWLVRLPVWLLVPLTLGALVVGAILSMAFYLVGVSLTRAVNLHVFRTDVYESLPRPKHTSNRWWWLVGDTPAIREAAPSEAHIQWHRDLKSDVYVYRGMFYNPRLIVGDVKGLNYILGQGQSYDYPKPEPTRDFLDNLLGNGLLVAEGDVHKRQRKIIQPAFNVSAIRALTPLFFRHANAFSAKISQMIDETKGAAEEPFFEGQSVQCAQISEPRKPVLDISHWFSRITLDIIGEAGFGHEFNAVALPVREQTDKIVESFNTLMKMVANITIVDIIVIGMSRLPAFWWAQKLPTERNRKIGQARTRLDKTGEEIIRKKREEIRRELDEAAGMVDEKSFFDERAKSKDLLYLMMKANMASDVRESERMSDSELLGQITTLLTAGHETTSTLLTWFIDMAVQEKNAHVVKRLRAEIEEHFAGRDELEYDALMAMPYLDNCTKEILRMTSPVTNTEREVTHDDMIPLSKEYTTRDGLTTFNAVPVKKGQNLFIPVHMMNRNKELWGETVDEFDPDRWDDVPRAAKESGFPMHILSFLEGPRGCIGNRFAVAEFKAILCILFRSFHFSTVGWEVERKQGVVVRPRIVGQESLGTQYPVRISRI